MIESKKHLPPYPPDPLKDMSGRKQDFNDMMSSEVPTHWLRRSYPSS